MTDDDTICAISTPPGMGGIAVIRVSGPQAIAISGKLWRGKPLASVDSHTAHLGTILTAEGEPLDRGMATVFRGPASFTGEDVVELSVHGSVYIQQRLVKSLIDSGARMAGPGEFTRRAFSNGRIDLAQAESVADMIASDSQASHRLAISQMRGEFSTQITSLHDRLLNLASLLELELDFSEEDVEFASREQLMALAREIYGYVSRLADSFSVGAAIKNGVPVALVGEPNAGKSTLLNLLVGDDKAIVSDIRGTTRDTIEDTVQLNGTLYRFIDTAGLRDSSDPVEQIGIEKAQARISKATVVLWLVDVTTPVDGTLAAWQRISSNLSDNTKLIILLNKTDVAQPSAALMDVLSSLPLPHSAKIMPHTNHTVGSLDSLRDTLAHTIAPVSPGDIIVTNARHYEALINAKAAIGRTMAGLSTALPPDFIAQDVRETIHHLATITGAITTDTILYTIFSRFCIGK